jgi:hypothetical protein
MRGTVAVFANLVLIFARSAIVIHAFAMAIMASRYSGTEVRSSSATHSSTWRLHSSSVFSFTMHIDMVMRFPSNCPISFYHTALRCSSSATVARSPLTSTSPRMCGAVLLPGSWGDASSGLQPRQVVPGQRKNNGSSSSWSSPPSGSISGSEIL